MIADNREGEMKLPVVRVFADDYSGIAVWPLSEDFVGASFEQSVGLSRSLMQRFEAWLDAWQDEVMPGRQPRSQHNAEGRQLAEELQEELRNRFLVVYEPEPE